MDVYLMQHGVAESEDVDPQRPLTVAGRAEVAAVAKALAAAGVRPDRIVHSDKLRATQTAQVLAWGLGVSGLSAVEGLHPKDPIEPVAGRWADPRGEGSVAIVGHLPFLDRLASLLVGGDPDGHVIAFRNAAMVALTPAKSRGGFSVAWIMSPDLVAGE